MKSQMLESKTCLKKLFQNQIYGILSYEHGMGRSVYELAERMLKGGIRILQYREKFRPRRVQLEECLQLRELTRKHNALFIINDYPDIAVLCEADGVHLGQDDIPVNQARQLLDPSQFIGVSTHTPDQAKQSWVDGADYIGVGPIYSTSTKHDVCPAVGLDYLKFCVQNSLVPCVAIGGVKEHNLSEVRQTGATCVALVTEITESADIAKKIERLWPYLQK